MPDHTLRAAAGAAFFTLVFFLLVAFQPAPPDVFSPDDASASIYSREDRAAAPYAPVRMP